MANDPVNSQGPTSHDPQRLRRLYRIITGEEPICPTCGEPLGRLIAAREAGARQDAYAHALLFVHVAMANRWSLVLLAEKLQAYAEATTAERP